MCLAWGLKWLNVNSLRAYLNTWMMEWVRRDQSCAWNVGWIPCSWESGWWVGIGLGRAPCLPKNLKAGISWYSLMMPWMKYCRVEVRCVSTTKNRVECVVCQAPLKLMWNYFWAFVLYFTVRVSWIILLIFSRILFGLISLTCYHVKMCYILV